MTVLVTADLHFSDKPRDAYRFEFVDQLLDMIHQYAVHKLLILGDLTEEKDRHKSRFVNQVADQIERLADTCSIIILRGNHDAIDPSCPFFRFVRHIHPGRILWVNSPMVLNVNGLGDCCFLPHTNNYERDWQPYKRFFTECSYIFTHATFKGVKVGGGPALDGLNPNMFPKHVKVIAGDIHAPVKIGRVEYVGAPYSVDFGDDYKPRVLLLDKDKTIRSIPCIGRQKRLVVVDQLDELPDILSDRTWRGDIVRVRVRIAGDGFHGSWANVRDSVAEICQEAGCELNSVQPIITDSIDCLKSGLVEPRGVRTDSDLVRDYCSKMKASDRVLRTGSKLL